MRLFGFGVWLVLLGILAGCSSGFCRTNASGCEKRIVGAYRGETRISNRLQPVVISFFHDEAGRLRGRYFSNYDEYFKNPFEYYIKGELYDVRPASEFMIRSSWVDDSGFGSLRAIFSFDGQEFTGYRGTGDDDISTAWYGKKILDKPLLSIDDLRELNESGKFGGS